MPSNPNALQTWYIKFLPILKGKVPKNPLFGVVIYIHHCSSYPVTFHIISVWRSRSFQVHKIVLLKMFNRRLHLLVTLYRRHLLILWHST
jgi:hypothetical protein